MPRYSLVKIMWKRLGGLWTMYLLKTLRCIVTHRILGVLPKFLEKSGPQGGGTTPWSCQPLRMTTLRVPKRNGSRFRDTGLYTEARYSSRRHPRRRRNGEHRQK